MTGTSRPFNTRTIVQGLAAPKQDFTQAIDSGDMEKRPLKRKRHHESNSSSLLASHPSYPTAVNLPHKMTSQRSVPAFLHKLFNMVGDPSTNQLVRWSKDGNSFLVEGHERFAKHVLPRFYKHNTFASFVRQLNMYDFHKVPHLQQGVLASSSSTQNEVWEFSHPHFQRNRPDLLVLVSRKRNRDRDKPNADQINLGSLVKEITAIRKHQANITADLRNLHHDNEIIWRETLAAREKFQKHQQVISKILQFLSAVFSDDQHTLLELSNHKDVLNINSPQLQDNKKGETKGKFDKFIASHDLYRRLKSNNDSDSQLGSSDNGTTNSDSGAANSDSGISSGNNSSEDDTKTPKAPSSSSSSSKVQLNSTDQRHLHFGSRLLPNDATRSAEAITSDIDELQEDVELLATQLGINPLDLSSRLAEIEKFSDSHVNMISSASRDEKMRLFQLADEDSQQQRSPHHPDLNHSYHVMSDFLVQPGSYHLNPQHQHLVQQALKQNQRHTTTPQPPMASVSPNNAHQQHVVNTSHVPVYVTPQPLTTSTLPMHQTPLANDMNIDLFDSSFRQRSPVFHSNEQTTINPDFCHTNPVYKNRYSMTNYAPYYEPPSLLQQHESNSLHSSIVVPTQPFNLVYPTTHLNSSPSSSPAPMKHTVASTIDKDKS